MLFSLELLIFTLFKDYKSLRPLLKCHIFAGICPGVQNLVCRGEYGWINKHTLTYP